RNFRLLPIVTHIWVFNSGNFTHGCTQTVSRRLYIRIGVSTAYSGQTAQKNEEDASGYDYIA
ncbi:hypothetical protein QLL62_002190, partial [Neisseria gonorrhoeae]